MIPRVDFIVLAAGLLLVAAACSSSGDSGGSSTSYTTWIDANRDGIYDPYQDPVLWDLMMAATSGQTAMVTASAREQHQVRHQWRDANGDGICDYAQNQNRWREICRAQWIDQNRDGVCDNYPGRPADGSGNGWQGGWQ